MRITVDRIEADRAVLELAGDSGLLETVDVPLAALPAGTKEGDCVAFAAAPSSLADAEARLARLKARTPQGPGSFDL